MKKTPNILLIPNPGIEVTFRVTNQNSCEVRFENKMKRKMLLYIPLLGGDILREQVFFLQQDKNLVYIGNRLDRVEGEGKDYLIITRPVLEKHFFIAIDIGETLITLTPNILSNYVVDDKMKEIRVIYSSLMPLVNSDFTHFRDDEGRLTYFALDSEIAIIKKTK